MLEWGITCFSVFLFFSFFFNRGVSFSFLFLHLHLWFFFFVYTGPGWGVVSRGQEAGEAHSTSHSRIASLFFSPISLPCLISFSSSFSYCHFFFPHGGRGFHSMHVCRSVGWLVLLFFLTFTFSLNLILLLLTGRGRGGGSCLLYESSYLFFLLYIFMAM